MTNPLLTLTLILLTTSLAEAKLLPVKPTVTTDSSLVKVLDHAIGDATPIRYGNLSANVVPSKYYIYIAPDFSRSDNDDEDSISNFTLHSKDLAHSSITLQFAKTGKYVQIDKTTDKDQIHFYVPEGLNRSATYMLSCTFTGKVGYYPEGIFGRMLKYNSTRRFVVLTNLSPSFARNAFPCFDEPYFRAEFQIALVAPSDFLVLSNTFMIHRRIEDGPHERRYATTHFGMTPLLPSYEISMLFGRYIPLATFEDFEVYGRLDSCPKLYFAHTVLGTLINEYKKMFGLRPLDLELDKIKIILIPELEEDVYQGWGVFFLKSDINHDVQGKQSYTIAMSRAVSRLWIGDGIVAEYWGSAWLHEGFADYFSYFVTDGLYPMYELEKQFVIDIVHPALYDDEEYPFRLTEPSIVSVNAIDLKNTKTTFQKVASFLRMLRHSMSQHSFDNLVLNYTKENIRHIVNPTQIVNYMFIHWPRQVPIVIEEYFRHYTEQIGYPIIEVDLADDRKSVQVTQRRHFHYHDGSDPNILYMVPLTYTTNLELNFIDTMPKYFLTPQIPSIRINFTEPIDWVIFNVRQTGLYRVKYDVKIYTQLHEALLKANWSGIHEINRAQFVDDLFSFGRASIYKYDRVFSWLEYLQTEIAYLPWKAAENGISGLTPFLAKNEIDQLGKFVLFLTKKAFQAYGFNHREDEKPLETYARHVVVNLNCRFGGKTCLENATNLVRNHMLFHQTIPINDRLTLYCASVRKGNELTYDMIFEARQFELDRSELQRMRYALKCADSPENVEKFFNSIWNMHIKDEERAELILGLMQTNSTNAEKVFDLVIKRLNSKYSAFLNWTHVEILVNQMGSYLSTERAFKAYSQFIDDNPDPFRNPSRLQKGLSQIDYNMKWKVAYLPELRSYLKSKAWRSMPTPAAAAELINPSLVIIFVLLLLHVLVLV